MTGIVVTFAVTSEGYQAMTELRRAPAEAGFTIDKALLIRRDEDGVTLLDSFGADEVILPDEAEALTAGTTALLAQVEESKIGAIDQALAHFDATVRHIEPDPAEARAAKRQAKHEARVERLAHGLASLKEKGKAAQAALDRFADDADARKAAAEGSLKDKIDRLARSADARLEGTRDQLIADLDTIASAIDDEDTGSEETGDEA